MADKDEQIRAQLVEAEGRPEELRSEEHEELSRLRAENRRLAEENARLAASALHQEEGQDAQGWAGAMVSHAQPMFDVSSKDVLKRIKLALVPFQGQEDAANDFRTRPDFYGPFWVASTAIFCLAASGNFGRLLGMKDAQDFESDHKLLSEAATMIYGLLVAVPLVVRLGLYCAFQSVDSINFKQVICVYGYSLAPLIPMSVVCLVPLGFLRWLAVLGGLGTSLAFIYGTLWTDLAVEAPSLKWKVLGLFCAAHVITFLTYRVYFFNSIS